MIHKESNYEKVDDIGKGLEELFRIYFQKMDTTYTLREFSTYSDEETEQIINNDKIKENIKHPNLVQIIHQRYEYKILKHQQKTDKIENQSSTGKTGEELLKELQEKLLNLQLGSEMKQLQQKRGKNHWIIQRLMENIQSTLFTFILNYKNKQKSLYELKNEEDSQLLEKEVNKSQGDINQSEVFNVSQEIKRHLEKINSKLDEQFPNDFQQGEDILQNQDLQLHLKNQYKHFLEQNSTECVEKQKANNQDNILPVQFIQLFLKQFVNLLAGMEFKQIPIRDIYPLNIFVPVIQPQKYDLLLGDMDEYQKFFFSKEKNMKKKITFSKTAYQFIGYMAPEMKDAYFKQQFRQNTFCPYKAGVFSLGLVAIFMATQNDMQDQNTSGDEKNQQFIKQCLKQVKQFYGRELKNVLKKMVRFDPEERPSFLQLDNEEKFNQFLEINHEEQVQSFSFKDQEEIKQQMTEQRILNIQQNARTLRFFKIETFGEWFDMIFSSQQLCNSLRNLHFMWSGLKTYHLNFLFNISYNKYIKFPNLISIQISGVDYFYVEELTLLLSGLRDKQALNLKNLDFSCSLFDQKCVLKLCEYKDICKQLTSLNLNSNQDLGSKGVEVLVFNYDELFQGLKYLSLGGIDRGCNLTQYAIQLLIEKFQEDFSAKQFKLKYLDLSWNSLDNDTFIYILNTKGFTQIKEVNLSNTNINIQDYRLTLKQKQIMKNLILKEFKNKE